MKYLLSIAFAAIFCVAPISLTGCGSDEEAKAPEITSKKPATAPGQDGASGGSEDMPTESAP